MANEAVIKVRGLVNAFDGFTVHDGLDLDVMRGEVLGVVGGSGTGKSVLLRSIIGLNSPQAGSIDLLGSDMLHGSEEERRADTDRLIAGQEGDRGGRAAEQEERDGQLGAAAVGAVDRGGRRGQVDRRQGGLEAHQMVGIGQVAQHLQLDRLQDRGQPQMARIPLRVKTIEREIAGVAGAELAVADALPRQFDGHVAGRTTIHQCRDVPLGEQVLE